MAEITLKADVLLIIYLFIYFYESCPFFKEKIFLGGGMADFDFAEYVISPLVSICSFSCACVYLSYLAA